MKRYDKDGGVWVKFPNAVKVILKAGQPFELNHRKQLTLVYPVDWEEGIGLGDLAGYNFPMKVILKKGKIIKTFDVKNDDELSVVEDKITEM